MMAVLALLTIVIVGLLQLAGRRTHHSGPTK